MLLCHQLCCLQANVSFPATGAPTSRPCPPRSLRLRARHPGPGLSRDPAEADHAEQASCVCLAYFAWRRGGDAHPWCDRCVTVPCPDERHPVCAQAARSLPVHGRRARGLPPASADREAAACAACGAPSTGEGSESPPAPHLFSVCACVRVRVYVRVRSSHPKGRGASPTAALTCISAAICEAERLLGFPAVCTSALEKCPWKVLGCPWAGLSFCC